jgi:flagellar protein FlaG
MAINPIDAKAGLELVHSKALQSSSRYSRPPTAAPDTAQAVPGVDSEQIKAEQSRTQAEAEQQQQPHQIQLSSAETLRFRVDKDSGKTVAELVDSAGEILRQMPTEEALELAKSLEKLQQGLIVNLKV